MERDDGKCDDNEMNLSIVPVEYNMKHIYVCNRKYRLYLKDIIMLDIAREFPLHD